MRFLDTFDKFLSNKRLYKENQAFWRIAVVNWCDVAYEEISICADGNPILHIYFPSLEKSFRIIQLDKQLGEQMNVRMGLVDFDLFSAEELVVTLTLSAISYRQTQSLLLKFIENTINEEDLAIANTHFDIVW